MMAMVNVSELWSDIMMLPHNGDMISSEEVEQVIKNIQTVDAVEVVRCEKCLYRSQYANENGMYKCGCHLDEDGDCFLLVKPDHFCSMGERRGSSNGK